MPLITDVKAADLVIDKLPCCAVCFANVVARPEDVAEMSKDAYQAKVLAAILAKEKERAG